MDVVDEADAVVRLAKTDPAAGLQRAQALVGDHDERIRARALWAQGRALIELARPDEAEVVLRDAAAAAPVLTERIHVTLGHALLALGRGREARDVLEQVRARAADAATAALATSQLGLLEISAGRLTTAVPLLEEALDPLRDAPEEREAYVRVLANLGYCLQLVGRLEESGERSREAAEIAAASGNQLVAAGSLHNLGCLEMLRGDLPGALRRLGEAERAYRAIDDPGRFLSDLYGDLAETHRLAGLTAEAVAYARRAGEVAGTDAEHRAHAAYRLARCLLDAGDEAGAAANGRLAAAQFQSAGLELWANRAAVVDLEAELLAAPQHVAARIDEVVRVTQELAAAGWVTAAWRVRNRTADVLLRDGRTATAWRVLSAEDEPTATSSGQLERAMREVLCAVATGVPVAEPLAAAHRLVVAHQLQLGDPEIRASTARSTTLLRHWAVEDALGGPAPHLLQTVDAWRAISFDVPRAVPLDDPELAELAGRTRAARAAAVERGVVQPEDAEHIAALERGMRRRSLAVQRRVVDGPPVAAGGQDGVAADLARRVEGRVFLEWFVHGGTLHLLVVDGARVEHVTRGPLAPVLALAERITQELARVLRTGLPDAVAGRRLAALEADCAALGALLGVAGLPTGAGVVVAPPPRLAALPWHAVLGPVPVTVTPSATAWLRTEPAPIAGRLGVVVGPGLLHGGDDVAGHDGLEVVRALTGDAATGAGLADLLADVDVLHVAAHGVFRTESPRFSHLELADGPFTLYELDRLHAPPVVSLAACDAGRSATRAGAELLGTAPAWFAAGARAVIGPVAAVPDHEAAVVAGLFLDALPGVRPAEALARAVVGVASAPPRLRATALATTCFGGDAGAVAGRNATSAG